jgi:hypothetical protein
MANALMLYYSFHGHVEKRERENRRGRVGGRGVCRREVRA